MAQNEMVNKGVTQIFTGLGILLGAGRISNATHEQILALLSADQSPTAVENSKVDVRETLSGIPRPGKETPVSVQSHDLLGLGGELAELAITEKSPHNSTRPTSRQKYPRSNGPPAPTHTKSGNEPKIICPWWFTEGYNCRDIDKGKCPMYHEDVPDGIRDPLICHFWADGGRCTKADAVCRFAHYPAQHRLIAPMPAKKKSKKSRTASANEGNQNDWFGSPRPVLAAKTDGDDYWNRQSHTRQGEEW